MQKLLILFLLSVLTAASSSDAWSAIPLDINAIEVDIRMQPELHRKLLARFESTDTSLTVPELAMVYYGFAFTPAYDPREDHSSLSNAAAQGNFEEAERLAMEALKLNPVSLELNVELLRAADRLRSSGSRGALLLEYGIKSDQIATAILSSGHGTSARSPFSVIYSADMEKILLNVLGVERIVDRTTVGDVVAFKVTFPGNEREHILYFDNSCERRFLMRHR